MIYGFCSCDFWSDLMRVPDGTGSVTPLSLPTVSVSPQPIGALMPFGQGAMPITSGMVVFSYLHYSLVASWIT